MDEERLAPQGRLLPGVRELLVRLSQARVPWAIATSGRLRRATPALEVLGVGQDVPVITRDQVRYAKPDPDLFLAAAERLAVPIAACMIVGDSVWDLLAARRPGRSQSASCQEATATTNLSERPSRVRD